jgi:hypothetical protein
MSKPFNSALETGVRSVAILTSVFPNRLDLQQLVYLDYLTLHSADVDGPSSLHAPLPLRAGELAVRRQLLEQGLLLMMNRGLVEFLTSTDGFYYVASEKAAPFLGMLQSSYMVMLRERTEWVAARFGDSSLQSLQELEREFLREWSTHFQVVGPSKDIEK